MDMVCAGTFCRSPDDLNKANQTYLVKGRLWALECHIPEKQIIVVLETDACAKLIVVLDVWTERG